MDIFGGLMADFLIIFVPLAAAYIIGMVVGIKMMMSDIKKEDRKYEEKYVVLLLAVESFIRRVELMKSNEENV
jgi:hypothetical protein